ncbi:heparinase II/III family protein [Hafnia alvei]|uniref:heparinase II/III domain-containing protein n=1 Tax=Hafnia alvei TaxID=569 RepID=UPI00345DA80D
MKQFNPREIAIIRQRAQRWPEWIDTLIADNATVLNHPLKVPTSGIATWNHYYYCPDHGVRLNWDYHHEHQHRCPVDNKIFSGEPYDGAWWRWMNGLNAKACYEVGLLWQVTANKEYFQRVRDLLLTYAAYYPDYQEHGGIPYNANGKINAQALCEANCLLDFARGYDLICDNLSTDEKNVIRQQLLQPGAEFLMQQRHDQIHNHEVKINSAIAVIGLILEKEPYLNFALNTRYGLRYQLEHSLINGQLWFEGSLHYHLYALQGFFAFEKVAKGTKYSLLDLPYYPRMLRVPLSLLMPNGCFPRLNDCVFGQEKLIHSDLYELAYSYYADPCYLEALDIIYSRKSDINTDFILYGNDRTPRKKNLPSQSTPNEIPPGLTLFQRPETQSTILIKHLPYGGEHDHGDSLGIIIFHQGKELVKDLGTTGYSTSLHRDYYKKTASHSTLTINLANQPPVSPVVNSCLKTNMYHYIDVMADWAKKADKPDSFYIINWDEKAYQQVSFRRRVMLIDNLVIDISTIKNPRRQCADLNWMINGSLPAPEQHDDVQNEKMLCHINPIWIKPGTGMQKTLARTTSSTVAIYTQIMPQLTTEQPSERNLLIASSAPDNPNTQHISQLTLRSHESEITYLTLFDLANCLTGAEFSLCDNTPTGKLRLSMHAAQCTTEILFDDEGTSIQPIIKRYLHH